MMTLNPPQNLFLHDILPFPKKCQDNFDSGVFFGRSPESEVCLRLDLPRRQSEQDNVVLKIPPVDSPQSAVKVAIAAKDDKH